MEKDYRPKNVIGPVAAHAKCILEILRYLHQRHSISPELAQKIPELERMADCDESDARGFIKLRGMGIRGAYSQR